MAAFDTRRCIESKPSDVERKLWHVCRIPCMCTSLNCIPTSSPAELCNLFGLVTWCLSCLNKVLHWHNYPTADYCCTWWSAMRDIFLMVVSTWFSGLRLLNLRSFRYDIWCIAKLKVDYLNYIIFITASIFGDQSGVIKFNCLIHCSVFSLLFVSCIL